MNARTKRVYSFILKQLKEASTWRGLILIVTGTGTVVNPEFAEALVSFGLIAAGLVGAIFPDTLSKGKE